MMVSGRSRIDASRAAQSTATFDGGGTIDTDNDAVISCGTGHLLYPFRCFDTRFWSSSSFLEGIRLVIENSSGHRPPRLC